MPLKSRERRNAITYLRNKANFLLQLERNEVKPARRLKVLSSMNRDSGTKNLMEYYPCVDCLGFYKKSYLWRHQKQCKSKTNNTKDTKRNHLTDSQTLLASTGLLGDYLNKSRLKADVFSIMKPDNISYTAKSDPLIFLYGEFYLDKHKGKQLNVAASNKLREIARLKMALKETTTIKSLFDALRPDMYNHIVTAAKVVSGYDAETKTFRSPFVARSLGNNVKFLCDVARNAIIMKHPLLRTAASKKQRLKEIFQLQKIVVSQWRHDVTNLASKSLNEKVCLKSAKLLPLVEQVQLFNSYIMHKADEAFHRLSEETDILMNYKILSECILSITLIFNYKRIDEVHFLKIEDYKWKCPQEIQNEVFEGLTELEKVISSACKMVVIFGNGDKPLPIFFTKKMQTFVDLILQIRKTMNLVPKSNRYLFTNPGSSDRWMGAAPIIRKFVHKCGTKSPELLTSTSFRKHISTILQLMNCEDNEMEQIAKFMGHTEEMEFYR